MKIKLKVEDNDFPNAWIRLPSLDRNHVFFQEAVRPYIDAKGVELVRKAAAPLRGIVDLANGTVSGIFSEIEMEVNLSKGLLKSATWTDAEIAAITLHELGHGYTYFEHLGTTARSALLSGAAAKAAMGAKDPEELLKILDVIELEAGVVIADKGSLANADKSTVAQRVQYVILTKTIHESRNENSAAQYSLRGCEQIADQYAARHGAGCDLVTSLVKLSKHYGNAETSSATVFVVTEIVKLVIFTCLSIGLYGIPLIVIWLVDPMAKIYDDPEQRITLVKQQLIDRLKDKHLDPELAKDIQYDIGVISDVEMQVNDRRTFYEMVWTTIIPAGRRNYDQMQIQKQIEQLINNDLYVQASKFKSGATT